MKTIFQNNFFKIIEVQDENFDLELLKGDTFDPEVNTTHTIEQLKKEEMDFEKKAENEGVFGYVLQYRYNGQWFDSDSCYGFIGQYDEKNNNHYIVKEFKKITENPDYNLIIWQEIFKDFWDKHCLQECYSLVEQLKNNDTYNNALQSFIQGEYDSETDSYDGPYEFYLVDGYFAKILTESGYDVFNYHGLNIFGRYDSGTAIYCTSLLNNVFKTILKKEKES